MLNLFKYYYAIVHPKETLLSLISLYIYPLSSCSTDEISGEATKEIETEATEDTEENEEPNEETETPTYGAITFETDFVLNEDRSFAS